MTLRFYAEIDIGHDAILEQHARVECNSVEKGEEKLRKALKDYDIIRIVQEI